jgi:hypothetical protein
MEVTCSPETSVDFQWTTQHIPEDRTLHKLEMFENLVPRKIFKPKNEVSGMFRIIHCDLYGTASIVRLITCEMLLWAEHVAHIRETRCIRKIVEFWDVMPCSLGDIYQYSSDKLVCIALATWHHIPGDSHFKVTAMTTKLHMCKGVQWMKPFGKSPLERPRRKLKYNITMNYRK